ncbi:hypothetical protein CLOP_g10756 [Closterium sp. NIES-67]|nr:hypothetical protein CLOP_g10756 [Closterium sp. NIES-67]
MAAVSQLSLIASPCAKCAVAVRCDDAARSTVSIASSFTPSRFAGATSSSSYGGNTKLSVAMRAVKSQAVVTCSLPHAWSARAIKTFGMAELEARKLKYPTTGTEALLMGMLTEGTNYGARFMRANGIKLMDLRVKTVELLGKADMYYFSAEHPPLTEPALAALQWAIAKHKELGRSGEISTALILLGIWEQRESAGHKLLSQLGFNDALASQLTSDLAAVPA